MYADVDNKRETVMGGKRNPKEGELFMQIHDPGRKCGHRRQQEILGKEWFSSPWDDTMERPKQQETMYLSRKSDHLRGLPGK